MGASESLLTRATLDVYRENITRVGHHLEIGTKAGWYLTQCNPPPEVGFTLLDRNPFNLTCTRKTLESNGYRTIQTHRTDIFDLPSSRRTFNSVGMNFVFNDLPGNICTQMDRTIETYKPYFDRDVCVFGNSLLGFIPGHPMNPAIRKDSEFVDDGPESIEVILNRHFEEYFVRIVAFDPEQRGFGVTWWGRRLRWKRKKVPPEYEHLLWGKKSFCIMENPAELIERPERESQQLLEASKVSQEATKGIEAPEEKEEVKEREPELTRVRLRSDEESNRI